MESTGIARSVDSRAVNTVHWLSQMRQFAIPVYQRDYRWDQAQCAVLLADIGRAGQTGCPHFLGSILTTDDSDGAVTLVDGQQRVTTLTLLCAALKGLVDDDPKWSYLDRVLYSGQAPTSQKLIPHKRNEAALARLLADTVTPLRESTYEANYTYFRLTLAADWKDVAAGLLLLENVVIELGETANAQQIFETLNSSGIRLTDEELIHNYIHMGLDHDEQVVLETGVWVPIEEATRAATREFWRDFLTMTSDRPTDFSGDLRVFQSFTDRYPDARRDLTPDVLAEWLRWAHHYEVLLHPSLELNKDIADRLAALGHLDATARPLVLAMYGDYRSGLIGTTELIAELGRLEVMLIRRAVTGDATGGDMVGTMCRELRAEGYPFLGSMRRTPLDPSVRLALTYAPLARAGYVLGKLQDASTAKSLEFGELEIEHVYPQTPKDTWTGDGGATSWGALGLEVQADFKTVLNTIGNLTLLEQGLNAGASNRPFHEKRPYYVRSGIVETTLLAGLNAWNRQTIQERTERLIERFLQTWPV